MNFEEAVGKILQHEGGFVDDPHDRGGATNYGITENVARANGYTGNMKDLDVEFAKKIYKKLYWDVCKCDELPEDIRYSVFDSAVNHGTGRAAKFLQKICGVTQDGSIGPVTLKAVKLVGPTVLDYTLTRADFYVDIVRNDVSQQKFLKGWLRRCVKVSLGY